MARVTGEGGIGQQGRVRREASAKPPAESRAQPGPRRARRAADRRPPASTRPGGRSSEAALAWFLGAVFLVKLVIVWQLKDHALLQPQNTMDSGAYLDLAKQVLAGNWTLAPGLYYVSPLYIYFLAFIYGPTGSITAIRIIQILLGTVSVGCLFVTARLWFGERAAWIAAGLAALTGLFTFYEAVLLQSSLDPVLTSAILLAVALALTREEPRWYVFAGLLFAVQSFNRPNVIVPAAVLLAGLLLVRRVRPAVWLTAGLLIGLAPVAMRNVVAAGEWSVLSSQGGLNFYIGNNDSAPGLYWTVPGVAPTIEGQKTDTRTVAEAALHRPLTDTEVSNYFYGLGLRWIRQHPGEWVRLFVRKGFFLLNAQHTSLPLSYPFYAYDTGSFLGLLFVGTWLLGPLGIVGLAFGPWIVPVDRRRDYLLWLTFVPAYFLSVIVFFVSERYRLPLLVPYAIGAGAAVDVALQYLTTRPLPLRPVVLLGVSVLIVALAVNWPLGIRDGDGRSEERVHMAEVLARQGRVDEAESWLARALPDNMTPGMAQYRVGLQFANASQYAPAITHLTLALRDRPGEPHAEFALGEALADSGQVKEAIPHLARAASSGVNIDLVGYDLAVAYMESGDGASAVRTLRTVKPGPSDDVNVWLDLGRLGLKLNAPDVAAPFLEHAVSLAPTTPTTHEVYGVSLLMTHQYDAARRELTTALSINSNDADSAANLAYVDLQLGLWAEARANVALTLRINPSSALGHQVDAALAHLGK